MAVINPVADYRRTLCKDRKESQPDNPGSAIEAAAKALWESETHHLMVKAGHAIDWPNLNIAVKRSMLRKARIAINAYENSGTNQNDEQLRLDFERLAIASSGLLEQLRQYTQDATNDMVAVKNILNRQGAVITDNGMVVND